VTSEYIGLTYTSLYDFIYIIGSYKVYGLVMPSTVLMMVLFLPWLVTVLGFLPDDVDVGFAIKRYSSRSVVDLRFANTITRLVAMNFPGGFTTLVLWFNNLNVDVLLFNVNVSASNVGCTRLNASCLNVDFTIKMGCFNAVWFLYDLDNSGLGLVVSCGGFVAIVLLLNVAGNRVTCVTTTQAKMLSRNMNGLLKGNITARFLTMVFLLFSLKLTLVAHV
jgi:hypothetical protein